MASRRRRIRLAVVLAAVVLGALIVPAASSSARETPYLDVFTDRTLLSELPHLDFQAYFLDSIANTERLHLAMPAGYGVSFVQTIAGTQAGDATLWTVTTPDGPETEYDGQLVVMDPSAYASLPSAEACAPGNHTAVWEIQATSKAGASLAVPIAVDRVSTHYELTMCFDDEKTQGLEISGVEFYPDAEVFSNPARAGSYLFDATVTPFAADGTANTEAAYELRAYQRLPQRLTAVAVYRRRTKTLSVSGTLVADGKARVGVNVHVYAGQTGEVSKQIGVAVTGRGGTYHLQKRTAVAPKFLLSQVNPYIYECAGTSAAPAGCVSSTIEGTDSNLVRVPRR
jgi:hypothetical protein